MGRVASDDDIPVACLQQQAEVPLQERLIPYLEKGLVAQGPESRILATTEYHCESASHGAT
jgi:hypothetical protein